MSTDSFWKDKADEVMEALLTRIPENKIRPRLEPTRRAVELLGDPQRNYRVIHVTGTNGKTSTTRIIERLLREQGLRTGRFTSPHLVHFNERIAIDGEPVSNEVLFEVWNDISPILEIVDEELIQSSESRLTFFEALAVLGFAVFADAPVDVLVLEVGMGGEWDSTNVADGDVAVFSRIGMDHADRLGDTISQIANTKAGIIKPGSFVVTSEQVPDAIEVLSKKAQGLAESMKIAGVDYGLTKVERDGTGQRISVQGLAGKYEDLFLPLVGEYQAQNAALAIAAVEAFLGGGNQKLSDELVRVAIADVSSPGRLQVVTREPLTLLDAAHNPDGAASLANALRDYFDAPPATGVVAVLAEKDAAGFFENLGATFASIVVTKSSSPRAVEPEELAKVARAALPAVQIHVAEDLTRALEIAEQLRPQDGAVVVTGSISLVGDYLAEIQKENE